MKKEIVNFADMTPIEIEQWEVKTNTIVVFDGNLGVAFQKLGKRNGGLAIMVKNSAKKSVIILDKYEAGRIKEFMQKHF